MIRPLTSRCRLAVAAMATLCAGCLSEQSFPMQKGDFAPVALERDPGAPPPAARDWLVLVTPTLNQLLPRGTKPPLLTDDLTRNGKPLDVMAHFGRNPRRLQTLFGNFSGIVHTAQCVGAGFNSGDGIPWPGFEEVWIPIREDLSLCGWLAMAREGGRPEAPVIVSNCIVLLPGLLGNHEINRTRDLARALLDHGHHVLSIELRGHGKTDLRYPGIAYNFGVTEAQDLMIISEWLEDQPHIRGTGLVGFCWGANTAMIAAWFDGRSADDPNLSPPLREILGPPRPGRTRRSATRPPDPAAFSARCGREALRAMPANTRRERCPWTPVSSPPACTLRWIEKWTRLLITTRTKTGGRSGQSERCTAISCVAIMLTSGRRPTGCVDRSSYIGGKKEVVHEHVTIVVYGDGGVRSDGAQWQCPCESAE